MAGHNKVGRWEDGVGHDLLDRSVGLPEGRFLSAQDGEVVADRRVLLGYSFIAAISRSKVRSYFWMNIFNPGLALSR